MPKYFKQVFQFTPTLTSEGGGGGGGRGGKLTVDTTEVDSTKTPRPHGRIWLEPSDESEVQVLQHTWSSVENESEGCTTRLSRFGVVNSGQQVSEADVEIAERVVREVNKGMMQDVRVQLAREPMAGTESPEGKYHLHWEPRTGTQGSQQSGNRCQSGHRCPAKSSVECATRPATYLANLWADELKLGAGSESETGRTTASAMAVKEVKEWVFNNATGMGPRDTYPGTCSTVVEDCRKETDVSVCVCVQLE